MTDYVTPAATALIEIPHFADERGELCVAELGKALPFAVNRVFYTYDVPPGSKRGVHAHRQCHQFLICIKGSLTCSADDGESKREFLLDSPRKGLHIPPMTWGTQYRYSPDAVLLVLASDKYDTEDYIHDYDEFIALVKDR